MEMAPGLDVITRTYVQSPTPARLEERIAVELHSVSEGDQSSIGGRYDDYTIANVHIPAKFHFRSKKARRRCDVSPRMKI